MLEVQAVLRGVNMKQVSRSALVSFSAQQMFNLVNDVDRYPEFLPGCSGSRVIESSSNAMVAVVNVLLIPALATSTEATIAFELDSITREPEHPGKNSG